MATTKEKTFSGAYPFRNKAMYLGRVRAHRKADELVRGCGWESNGTTRGCAVGCTLHCYDHKQYPKLLGVPEQIAHLEDFLFENLPKDHLKWPERFLSAIKEGADLSNVYPQWVFRMLTRRLEALGDGEEAWRKQVREAIGSVRDLYRNGMPTKESAAWSAASAARSAESAAWSAAWSAESAESAAWSAEVQRQADDLIELLKAAPMA